MSSDALHELSDERLGLWKLLLNPSESVCNFPLLGQSPVVYQPLSLDPTTAYVARNIDPVIVQVRTSAQHTDEIAVFILNAGETTVQRSYPLSLLGLPSRLFAFDWTHQQHYAEPIEQILVTIPAHDSTLIFLSSVMPATYRAGY